MLSLHSNTEEKCKVQWSETDCNILFWIYSSTANLFYISFTKPFDVALLLADMPWPSAAVTAVGCQGQENLNEQKPSFLKTYVRVPK